MTSNTELAKNFIKNHNIKNFQQLNELLREFYYAPDKLKKEIGSKYGTEDYKAFIWMQVKYVNGKIGKLKNLFSTVELFSEAIKNIDESRLLFLTDPHVQELMISPISTFNSTRHKANPNNTNYHHVNSPDERTSPKETYSDTAGNKKEYEYEQNVTSTPEFKNIDEIFVTYFTPAEHERELVIVKQQEISKEDILNCYMTPLINPDNYLPKQELPSTDYKLRLNESEQDKYISGKKESEGKLFYEFDWEFIEACAKRMQNNKGKYPPFNWKKPIDVQDLIQAQNRHHIEVMKGSYKDGDEEFGHLTSYMCNAMLIYHQLKNFPQK